MTRGSPDSGTGPVPHDRDVAESGPVEGPAEKASDDDRQEFGVALLLAIAAVSAALMGGWAAILGVQGAGELSVAVREDVRRGARIVGDARRLYEEDASVSHRVAELHLLGEELDRAAAEESGSVDAVLRAEAEANRFTALVLAETSELADGDPEAATQVDGGDLLARFAEIRAERSDELASLDPDATQADAEDDERSSAGMIGASLFVAFAFLLGALAEVMPGSRRPLLVGGYASVAIGIVAAVVIGTSS